jgi:hypothetical protein
MDNESAMIEPVRWEGLSSEKIATFVAADQTSTSSMHSVAANLIRNNERLHEALRHAEAGHAEYAAATAGPAAEVGGAAIGSTVESLRTLVQSATLVPQVINNVAGGFDTAKAEILGQSPRTASRFDADGLPLSWMVPPPADQIDDDEVTRRRNVRDAMARYEREAADELRQLPAFNPVRHGAFAEMPLLVSATPPMVPTPDAERTTPVRLSVELPTEPIRRPATPPTMRPPRIGSPVQMTHNPSDQMSRPHADFGPVGHLGEDAEFEAQQAAGQVDPRAESHLPWRSDLASEPPTGRTTPTSLFETDEKTAPPVIGE